MKTKTNMPTTATPSDLEDIAAELTGISSALTCVVELVRPKETTHDCDMLTEHTIEGAFFAIERQIERIADQLTDIANEQRKTATPTDESKDCR